MAKVFIGIALIFMLATAGIGYVLKGNVDKLQQARAADKGKITAAEGKERAAKADAEKAQTAAKEASDKADAAAQTAAAKTKEAADATAAVAEKTQLVDSLTAKVTELNDKISKMGPAGVDPAQLEQLKAQIAQLTTDKENAEKEKQEAKLALNAEVARGKENEQKVADLQKEQRRWQSQFQKPGIQGRILAVNSGWNFVVLSVGDRQGVVVNSALLVVRGNEPIARLRVTSVEPSTSIADVLPGTVRKGTAVQPGDTVIFEGNRNQAPQVPKSAPETTPTVPPIAPSPALPNS